MIRPGHLENNFFSPASSVDDEIVSLLARNNPALYVNPRKTHGWGIHRDGVGIPALMFRLFAHTLSRSEGDGAVSNTLSAIGSIF